MRDKSASVGAAKQRQAAVEIDGRPSVGGEHLDAQPLTAHLRRLSSSVSTVSSSWNGSWWNNAKPLRPAADGNDTAYSTVQWPHVRLCSNSLAVYCASWISRSTPRHSSSTDSAIVVGSSGCWWSLM